MLFCSRLVFAFALGRVASLVSAQTPSIPTVLPGNWSSVGCFTDVSTSRTLQAASTTGDDMTVEKCITFCSSFGVIFAGVEFGHCDSTIQIPGEQANLGDCTFACGGNATETCGGPNRLNVFNSGGPVPQIVQNIAGPANVGAFLYQGCFTDSVSARTLGVPVNVPVGVTPESCTAACMSLGGFANAGVEAGRECWCDKTINSPAQHVSDADCRQICDANHAEYCGNNNRVAVYHFSNSTDGSGGANNGTQECISTDLGASNNFSLKGRFRNGAQQGQLVSLKVIAVEIARGVTWTILSACSACCSEWPSISLTNSIVFPHSSVVQGQLMSSIAPRDGESPAFVASNPAFPGVQAWCTMADPTVLAAGNPPLLALGGKSDTFALCPNNTVNNRMDLVFSPVTGHPHYDLNSCQGVDVLVESA